MEAHEIIKLLRIQSNISQKDFAKKTKISANYISLIESGKRTPSVDFLTRAAEALGIPVNLLLWEDVDFSKIKDKKTKDQAKKIEKNLSEIRDILIDRLVTKYEK